MIISFSSNISSTSTYNSFIVLLDDRLFNFTVKWNNYAKCAFLWFYDADMNPIVSGKALVNGLLIRTDRRKLPQDLRFAHIRGETYEPTLDNIGEEFAFYYGG